MIDLARFKNFAGYHLARSELDPNDVAELFKQIQAICAELQGFREGAQRRTLEEAARLRALDREVSKTLNGPERIAALQARTGFKRTKLYRLLKLSRRPVLNGIPDLNGTDRL